MFTFSKQKNSTQLYCFMAAYLALALIKAAQAYPTASIDFYSTTNKLNDLASKSTPMDEVNPSNGAAANDNSAAAGPAPLAPSEINFHQFINSKSSPDSTIIGELKPNSSAWELMLLRSKIAETILKMQKAEQKQQEQIQSSSSSQSEGAECFIEVTRVEKIPGKCHRANNGVPICQSENYIAISNDCN